MPERDRDDDDPARHRDRDDADPHEHGRIPTRASGSRCALRGMFDAAVACAARTGCGDEGKSASHLRRSSLREDRSPAAVLESRLPRVRRPTRRAAVFTNARASRRASAPARSSPGCAPSFGPSRLVRERAGGNRRATWRGAAGHEQRHGRSHAPRTPGSSSASEDETHLRGALLGALRVGRVAVRPVDDGDLPASRCRRALQAVTRGLPEPDAPVTARILRQRTRDRWPVSAETISAPVWYALDPNGYEECFALAFPRCHCPPSRMVAILNGCRCAPQTDVNDHGRLSLRRDPRRLLREPLPGSSVTSSELLLHPAPTTPGANHVQLRTKSYSPVR